MLFRSQLCQMSMLALYFSCSCNVSVVLKFSGLKYIIRSSLCFYVWLSVNFFFFFSAESLYVLPRAQVIYDIGLVSCVRGPLADVSSVSSYQHSFRGG